MSASDLVMANQFTFRAATVADRPFLREMLWLAFRWREAEPPPMPAAMPRELAKYVQDFPCMADHGVLAVTGNGVPAGAAWYRLLSPGDPGYGFVDATTPEITIAVQPEFRGHGVGTSLLRQLIADAGRSGLVRLSLSVEPDNPALSLYSRLGLERVGECGGSWTMVVGCEPGAASGSGHS